MCTTPEDGLPRARRIEAAVLTMGIGAYTAAFTALAVLRYRSFYAHDWQDLAGINQAMWSAAHGQWFFQTVTEQHFMGHFQPVLALGCLPYLLAPRVTTLFLLSTLAVALGAVPVYLLGRRELGTRAGLMWALAYLLYSPLHNVTLTDFRPVVLCIPCLLAALYVFEEKRFGWYCFWCAATVLCQESLGLVVAFLGPYAMWRRRSLRWVLTPTALGVLWFAVCTRFIMPALSRDVAYPLGGYLYLWIGNQEAGVLITKILRNPLQYALLALSPSRLELLFKAFWPLCFLPFAAPVAMLVPAASWFQLLMVHHSALHAVRVHWLAPMIPTFFFAAIMGTRWIARVVGRSRSTAALGCDGSRSTAAPGCDGSRSTAAPGCVSSAAGGRCAPALSLAVLAACALSNLGPNSLAQTSGTRPVHNPKVAYVKSVHDPVLYRMDAEDRVGWEAVAAVPAEASVAASGDLMPALSHRNTLYELGFTLQYLNGRERDDLDVDYVAIHARCESYGAGTYNWPGLARLRERTLKMLATLAWEPAFMQGRFLVLRRVHDGRADPAAVRAAARHIAEHWSDADAEKSPGGRSDLARSAYQAGDPETAVRHYAAQARMSARDPYPCRKAGQILWQLGRQGQALDYFKKARARSPLCLDSCLSLAKALLAVQQLEAAEREYRAAIRLLPTDPEPYLGLGMVHLARADTARAEAAFRRAVRLDPSYSRAKKLLERCRGAR